MAKSGQQPYSDADYSYYEHVQRGVQEEQTLTNYLELTQLAFKTCVHNFTHHEVTRAEQKCITAVTQKWIKSHLRATMRFSEAQVEAAKKQREEREAAAGIVRR